MTLLSRQRGSLGDRLAALKWQYRWNFRATLNQRLDGHRLGAEGARMLSDLCRDGIAISSTEALWPEDSLFEELATTVERLEEEQAEQIREGRLGAAERRADKAFIWRLLGDKPAFDPSDIFLRFALRPELIGIANAYLGLFSELRYFNVWHTFRTEAPPQRSQLWHRDRDDRRIVKAFVYLNDVEEGNGPFVYAPGTHARGAIHREPESFKEKGHGNLRSTDEQMAAVVPEQRWIRARGHRGTLILADTTGYHRGGLARTGDRLLYTFMFVSPISDCPASFEPLPPGDERESMDIFDDPIVAWAARRGLSRPGGSR